MGLDMYLNAELYVSNWNTQITPVAAMPGVQVFEVSGKPNLDNPTYDTLLEASGLADLATPDSHSITLSLPVAYWRKANAIHAWFVEHVQDGKDECQTSEVSLEQLTELRDTCATALASYKNGLIRAAGQILPPRSGFMFGSTEVDDYYAGQLANTIKQLDKILNHPKAKSLEFTYRASW